MSEKKTSGPMGIVLGLIALVAAGLGYLKIGGEGGKKADSGTVVQAPQTNDVSRSVPKDRAPKVAPRQTTPKAKPRQRTVQKPVAKKAITKKAAPKRRSLIVHGPNGRTDLAPTLERIEKGIKHRHRNDGSVFGNRERRLPRQPRGYYHEYVHPTRGQRGPGAQRIIIGKKGEVYYTADHYKSFRRVKWTFRRR